MRVARDAGNKNAGTSFRETHKPRPPDHEPSKTEVASTGSSPQRPIVHDGRWTWTDWSMSGEDVGAVHLRTTGDLDEEEDKASWAARGGEVD